VHVHDVLSSPTNVIDCSLSTKLKAEKGSFVAV